jgi:P-type Ca2+ transporter type 2C
LLMLLAPFMGIIIALNPMQLLWLNLLTDGFLGLGLGIEPSEKNTMKRRPRRAKDPILNKMGLIHVTWTGLLIAGISLGVAYVYFDSNNPQNTYWQSMVFATIGFTQIGHALGLRASSRFIFSITSNLLFTAMFVLTLTLHLSVIYIPFLEQFFDLSPLNSHDLLLSVGFGVLVMILVQVERMILKNI